VPEPSGHRAYGHAGGERLCRDEVAQIVQATADTVTLAETAEALGPRVGVQRFFVDTGEDPAIVIDGRVIDEVGSSLVVLLKDPQRGSAQSDSPGAVGLRRLRDQVAADAHE